MLTASITAATTHTLPLASVVIVAVVVASFLRLNAEE
jgi:hypothetical protein